MLSKRYLLSQVYVLPQGYILLPFIYNLHFVRALTCLFERSYNKILIKSPGNYKKYYDYCQQYHITQMYKQPAFNNFDTESYQLNEIKYSSAYFM